MGGLHQILEWERACAIKGPVKLTIYEYIRMTVSKTRLFFVLRELSAVFIIEQYLMIYWTLFDFQLNFYEFL